MAQLDIDGDLVEDCVDESFEQSGDYSSVNLLIDEDTAKSSSLGIYLHPGLTINDMTYRGYIEGQDVFDAVCSSFPLLPEACKDPFDKEISANFNYTMTF